MRRCLACRLNIAEDDGEQRPVDEVIDDSSCHYDGAHLTLQQAQIHEDARDNGVGRIGEVHADEEGKGDEVRLQPSEHLAGDGRERALLPDLDGDAGAVRVLAAADAAPELDLTSAK